MNEVLSKVLKIQIYLWCDLCCVQSLSYAEYGRLTTTTRWISQGYITFVGISLHLFNKFKLFFQLKLLQPFKNLTSCIK